MTDVELTVSSGGGPAQEAAAVQPTGDARGSSQWASAWGELRRNPLFWISSALILLFVVMAAVPQLFTSTDPYTADLSRNDAERTLLLRRSGETR